MTIEANKKCVNFLDLTLDLRTGTYKPYTKPGNVPQYVSRHSNHPPSVLRAIPESINRRRSTISSDKKSFDSAKQPYQEALTKSGYDYNLQYNPPQSNERRKRNRNIIWFNPPYSCNVASNIGHKFLKIVDESFPRDHPLRKIFNRNTLKLSYSCMPNIKNIITSHNKSILVRQTPPSQTTTQQRDCNCRKKDECPASGKCLTESVVYQATVTREDTHKEETYVGLTENTFKTRFSNHMQSFRNQKMRNSTELSKFIWSLKESHVQYAIRWKILKRCKPYSSTTKRCNLCLHEKFVIIHNPELSTLNRRNN